MTIRRRALQFLTTGLTGAVAAAVLVSPAAVAPVAAAHSPWKLLSVTDESTLAYNEGLATDSAGRLTGRGYTSIRPDLAAQGWTHIGDHDIDRGYTYDAYENLDVDRKLYTITSPRGTVQRYYHPLTPDEMANNSFVTVDPTGTVLVSGEWETEQRLLVFDNPNGRRSGSTLPLAGEITLSEPLTEVQSCDFKTSTVLLCAVDKPVNAVYSVTLDHPLTQSRSAHGTVAKQFDVPRMSACRGSYELEGIDYDRSRRLLSVAAIDPSPCLLNTKVFRYSYRP